ncbi:ATP-dependent DNA helicase [Sinorhizobium medicae]|uniref:ATP-dependent DNA helicase n=1 Tax=Sinorhizobium medicae TaxID=110321 RepID=UPI001296FDDE|nr:AAA family ATPase [Sinorhizobium medicae]MQX77485.1 AAA family ATPase [Sinorhizobium medicae]
MKLSEEQEEAVLYAMDWYKHGRVSHPVFRLFGYAGTGKTTVLNQLTKRLGLRADEIMYMSPSGKAASVMTSKGCKATTIHRVLYRFVRDNTDQMNALMEERDSINDKLSGETEHREALARRLAIVERELASPSSRPQPEFTFLGTAAVASEIRLLVVDECSMVANSTFNDLASLCLPIIFVGDPAQLPAIEKGKAPSKVLEPIEPYAQLTQVHRQAGDSSILDFATRARNGDTHFAPEDREDFVSIYDRRGWTIEEICNDTDINLHYFDQVICWKNDTRRIINWYMKQQAGVLGTFPVGNRSEKLISIGNIDLGDAFVSNGSMIEVGYDGEREGEIKVRGREDPIDLPVTLKTVDGRDTYIQDLSLWKLPFEEWDWQPTQQALNERLAKRRCIQAEWGWAITVNKAQGSEWEKVCIVDDYLGRDRPNWLYTAITRASKQLVIIRADFR